MVKRLWAGNEASSSSDSDEEASPQAHKPKESVAEELAVLDKIREEEQRQADEAAVRRRRQRERAMQRQLDQDRTTASTKSVDESSTSTSSSSSEEDDEPEPTHRPLLKPVFLSKAQRLSIAAQKGSDAASKVDPVERKKESHQMVEDELRRERKIG